MKTEKADAGGRWEGGRAGGNFDFLDLVGPKFEL